MYRSRDYPTTAYVYKQRQLRLRRTCLVYPLFASIQRSCHNRGERKTIKQATKVANQQPIKRTPIRTTRQELPETDCFHGFFLCEQLRSLITDRFCHYAC